MNTHRPHRVGADSYRFSETVYHILWCFSTSRNSNLSKKSHILFIGSGNMYYNYDERPIRLAEYILEHKATVRQTAKKFGVSKSTIHMVVIK